MGIGATFKCSLCYTKLDRRAQATVSTVVVFLTRTPDDYWYCTKMSDRVNNLTSSWLAANVADTWLQTQLVSPFLEKCSRHKSGLNLGEKMVLGSFIKTVPSLLL